MSSYIDPVKDIINRTKSIIEQYENFFIEPEKKYEETLFINCLVGLLIIPQQHWFGKLPKDIVALEEWGICPDSITIIKSSRRDEDKNIENIARHMRNSVSHYNFKVIPDDSGQINKIEFFDKIPKTQDKTFEATIDMTGLKLFTNKLIEALLRE